MDERRTAVRVPVSETVVVVLGDRNVVGEVRDVSAAGMFVATANPTSEVGVSVLVHLSPGHAREAVELPGIVRWIDHRGFGLQLTVVGGRELAAIDALTRPLA
jgi:hypothetical protein